MPVVTITASMASSPILGDPRWPIMLDGLLAWRVLAESMGSRFGSGDPDCAAADAADLPLRRAGDGDDWVWVASRGWPSEDVTDLSHTHSRNDPLDYERRTEQGRPKMDETRAEWKPTRKPRVATVCGEMKWMADSSDPDRLLHILRNVRAVGQLATRGYGQVAEWGLTESGTVDEIITAAARPVPSPGGTTRAGIRPPYWHPNQHRMVVSP